LQVTDDNRSIDSDVSQVPNFNSENENNVDISDDDSLEEKFMKKAKPEYQ
jgi:hypothetical protein